MNEEPHQADPSAATFQTLDRHEGRPYPLWEYAGRALWAVVENTLFRWSFPRCFAWRAWLLRRFGARIGHKTRISRTCTVMHPWLLSIGDWSSIGHRVAVYNLGQIEVGSHSAISQDVYLCAGTHDHASSHLPLVRSRIWIDDGVWVAAGAFIGPNVRVGRNALVAARAVVMHDVPIGMIVRGNPAAAVRPREMLRTASPT